MQMPIYSPINGLIIDYPYSRCNLMKMSTPTVVKGCPPSCCDIKVEHPSVEWTTWASFTPFAGLGIPDFNEDVLTWYCMLAGREFASASDVLLRYIPLKLYPDIQQYTLPVLDAEEINKVLCLVDLRHLYNTGAVRRLLPVNAFTRIGNTLHFKDGAITNFMEADVIVSATPKQGVNDCDKELLNKYSQAIANRASTLYLSRINPNSPLVRSLNTFAYDVKKARVDVLKLLADIQPMGSPINASHNGAVHSMWG